MRALCFRQQAVPGLLLEPTPNKSEVSRPNLMREGGLLFTFAMLIMLTVLLEYIDLWYKYLAKHFLLCWRYA